MADSSSFCFCFFSPIHLFILHIPPRNKPRPVPPNTLPWKYALALSCPISGFFFSQKETFNIHNRGLLGHDICPSILSALQKQISVQLEQRDFYCNINQRRKTLVHFKSVNMCTSAYFGVGVWLDIGTQPLQQSSMLAASSGAQSPCLSSRCLGEALKHRDRQERGASQLAGQASLVSRPGLQVCHVVLVFLLLLLGLSSWQ